MGNHITWEKPLPDATWTDVRIERSSTQLGVYTQIASQAISDSTYFDVNGLTTDWYKIRFFDSVNSVASGYSESLQGTTELVITGQATNDILKRTITGVNILGSLGASGPDTDGNYNLFGMKIHQNVAEATVRQCYNYCTELIGESRMVLTDNNSVRQIEGYITSYAALRILGILAGVSITTHYNYTLGGFNVQKPAVSQIAAMMDLYRDETKRWSKVLLTRGIATTGPTNLSLAIINEQAPQGSGIMIVTFDAVSL